MLIRCASSRLCSLSSQKCPGHWVDLKSFGWWPGLPKGARGAGQDGMAFEEFPYVIGVTQVCCERGTAQHGDTPRFCVTE